MCKTCKTCWQLDSAADANGAVQWRQQVAHMNIVALYACKLFLGGTAGVDILDGVLLTLAANGLRLSCRVMWICFLT